MSSIAFARIYQRSFESHPHYTLALTNGTLNALGDVVAQSVQLLVRSSHLFPLNQLSPPNCSRQTDKEMNTTSLHMTPRERCVFLYSGLEWVRPYHHDTCSRLT